MLPSPGLLSGSNRLLITNQVQFLQHGADHILVLDHGRVVQVRGNAGCVGLVFSRQTES